MSGMRDPFDNDDFKEQPAPGATVDLSGFAPQRAIIPPQTATREVEAISASNGFGGSRPATRRRRGPIRHPWTIRAPIELRRDIENLGESLDLRDDDVIRHLLDHYRATT